MGRLTKIALTLVIFSISLTMFYNNCAQPGNTLTSGSAGFPQDALIWRPNHIASFSCGPDGLLTNSPTTYAYPSFWLWYSNQSVATDPYPAGLALSLDAQTFIQNGNLSSAQILPNLIDLQPVLTLINGVNDSTASATGWYPAVADPTQINTDYSMHTAYQTSSGTSQTGYNNALTLSNKQVVPINDMRTTTTAYPPVTGAATSFSIGLLFHAATGQTAFNNLTYTATVNGQSGVHVAGEALQMNIWGRAVDATTNGGYILPYNASGLDRAQISTTGGHTHTWVCQRWFVTVPAGQGQTAQCGANYLPSGLGDISRIEAMGTFGTYANIPCFVPSASFYKQYNQNCYAGVSAGYDPIAQTNTNSGTGTPAPKPAWFQNSDGTPNATPWRSADSQSPHWLSICYRQTDGQ